MVLVFSDPDFFAVVVEHRQRFLQDLVLPSRVQFLSREDLLEVCELPRVCGRTFGIGMRSLRRCVLLVASDGLSPFLLANWCRTSHWQRRRAVNRNRRNCRLSYFWHHILPLYIILRRKVAVGNCGKKIRVVHPFSELVKAVVCPIDLCLAPWHKFLFCDCCCQDFVWFSRL